jgi:phosphate/phosphite/phosphonate ABC transporter binding protein
MDKIILGLLFCLIFGVGVWPVQAKEDQLILLIPPVEEVNVMYRQFLPIQRYLEQELGLQVQLTVERNYEAALEKIGQGKADLAYLDPAAYCEARHEHGVLPLLKSVRQKSKECGSVLVVRQDSPVQKIVQAKGKSLALGNVHSSSSYLMPLAMFRQADLDLDDFSQVGYLQKEDQVALSVLVGDYDVGALSQAVAEKYTQYGLRIIHCSEPLPGFVLSSSGDLDKELQQAVQQALLSYKGGQVKGLGFEPTQDQEYDGVRIMLRNIAGKNYLHYPQDALKLGLLPLYSAISMHEMFQPLAEYLAQSTDREFRLVIPKDFEEFVQIVRQGEVDFTFQNPYVHLLLARKGYLEPLALAISPEPEEPRQEFRGVILTRKDSDIQGLQDLQGKRIMVVSHKSAGGYWFQKILLRQKLGLDISQEAELVEGKRHEEVILALYRGDVEAGFVREAALFQAQDLVDMEQIKVLARTPYYPNWPFSAARHVPKGLARQVQKALLRMQDQDLLRKARIHSFTETDKTGLQRLQELVEFE